MEKLTAVRTRRVGSRLIVRRVSSPLSTVRDCRSFRNLARWASFLVPDYSTHVPSNFRRNSHKTNDWCTRQAQLKSRPKMRGGRYEGKSAALKTAALHSNLVAQSLTIALASHCA